MYLDDRHEILTKPDKPNTLSNQMVAMGKALMRAKKLMSIEERKLLIMALTKMRWNERDNSLTVRMSKVEIAEILEWSQTKKLKQLANNLMIHSKIEFAKQDEEFWKSSMLIIDVETQERGILDITFNPGYRDLLENLSKDRDFVTIWANDVYKFNSVYAYLLFEDLRLHSDTRHTNWRTYTTRELKELFDMPESGKGSYMHFDKRQNKEVFNRTLFEKKVLEQVIKEINQTEMLKIKWFAGCEASEKKPNALYQKEKKNGYVAGYTFKYDIYTHVEASDRYIEAEAEDMQLEGQMSIEDYIN